MPCTVQVFILIIEDAWFFGIAFGRNDYAFPCMLQRNDDAFLSIICFVCNYNVCLDIRQKLIGTFKIVGLPRCQRETRRVTQRIDSCIDFRTEPSATSTDGFLFRAAFFLPPRCAGEREL